MPIGASRKANLRAACSVFAAGLAMRFLFIVGTKPYQIVDGTEEVAIAHSLAAHHGFSDPFRVPTGPTAHSSPAYPFILSLVYRAAPRDGHAAELIKEALATLVASAQFALLPLIAVGAGLPLAAGIVAGLLGALLPLHPYLEVKGEWTAAWCGLVLLLLTLILLRSWQAKLESWVAAIGRGLAFGVSLWFTPVFLPVIAGWLVVELWLSRRRIIRHAARALLVSGGMMAILQVPWAIRNDRALGRPVWSRDNLGLELQLAFGDYSRPYYLDTRANLAANGAEFAHPNASAREAAELRQRGEIAYNAVKLDQARAWISAHPARALELIGMRTVEFWFPLRIGFARFLLASALTLLAWWGWWRLRRRSLLLFLALGVIWLGHPLVYYIIQSEPRYAYPIFWSKLLAVGSLWPLLKRQSASGTTPR